MNTNVHFIEMLRNGVIMDVMTKEQAVIAEKAGASAVMALERVPAIIIKEGGIARASDTAMIQEIQSAVSIPVMAKCRIGHFVEAQILEALDVDCIDESEVLTKTDESAYINKKQFITPFVCGCTSLWDALRRIDEGASLIRCKGQAGTGNIAEAVKHLKEVTSTINTLQYITDAEVRDLASHKRVPLDLLMATKNAKKLPVPFFAAGGIATPADAALCMALGAEAVFVGSGIFLSENPEKRANAIVQAVNDWNNPKLLAKISANLGVPMR
ncbi:pyridoxal 5'-phosphate synthase lyase subunit PdxS [Candidatus Lariskella endosymbiont of Hedychridium roseum]|uniref:pyridoxal 5'-phosphate synthase lyase subunit PdxS n=1 Tax=Candidatus Lariskella endosymbiont of Hedychridium roseum TaxID=3077949 RepID=UPI0030CBBAA7